MGSVRSSCECGEGSDWLDDRMEEEVEVEEEEVEEVVVEVGEVEEEVVVEEEEEVVEKTKVTKH